MYLEIYDSGKTTYDLYAEQTNLASKFISPQINKSFIVNSSTLNIFGDTLITLKSMSNLIRDYTFVFIFLHISFYYGNEAISDIAYLL